MRILEIATGLILLGGAAWTTVRTYRSRGVASWLVLSFAIFLAALGLFILFGAVSEVWREFRLGGNWIK
ncbi:hypothetical protein [Pyrinomonas methylaliphatogenes]|uniref:Uncharacterized protein n=1 Tax=Pyrinomonas methylaliphatogenes TaxID=454194 RepID=A0A0B6WVR9_9BACT|nr:hypothetical protein [Pyrinomonas methylaliphatogenes]CDM65373.1 hypothetical protein PYK22_01372 [Pyrinomonas methylaliphatogenes]